MSAAKVGRDGVAKLSAERVSTLNKSDNFLSFLQCAKHMNADLARKPDVLDMDPALKEGRHPGDAWEGIV